MANVRRSVVWGARRRAAAVASAAALLALPASQIAHADDVASPSTTRVIITSNLGSTGHAHGRAASLHAKHVDDVDVVAGVVADVTPGQLADLSADPSVTVTPDAPVFVADTPTTSSHTPAAVFPQSTGAIRLWNNGYDGSGVNVAVVDTGISKLPDFAGRIVGGIDLSGEGNPLQDSYGHGTFVAGLIAGNGASSNGAYMGEAPGAGLVAVKVAGATGATDVATVIQGINWAVANQGKLNIKVMNLSLGAIPTQSSVTNPLDKAVESAWASGITVVASAGNAGPFNGTILSPGDDPMVITAGAVDDMGTPALSDDVSADFSSVGPTNPDGWYKPDVVASGRSVVSLRAPGSTIDTQNPTARIGTGNFVGSGTSFSAAVTSGAAAIAIQKSGAKPDNIKARLVTNTNPGPTGNPYVDGHGQLNLTTLGSNSTQMKQAVPTVATPMGATVSLSTMWLTSTWNPANFNGTPYTGSAWNGSAWNGSAWNGSAWNGSAWNGSAWNSAAWNSAGWNGSAWNGSAWNGSAWNGSAWNGSAWNSGGWNSGGWNSGGWNSGGWNSGGWNSAAWN